MAQRASGVMRSDFKVGVCRPMNVCALLSEVTAPVSVARLSAVPIIRDWIDMVWLYL